MACESSFSVKNHLSGVRHFCSKQCRTSFKSVDIQCATCGSVFSRLKSQGADVAKYCSKACANKGLIRPESKRSISNKRPKKPSPVKVCETCKNNFTVIPSRLVSARFCSVKCKGENIDYRKSCSEIQHDEKHWRWSGGKYKTGQGYVRLKRKRQGSETVRFEHTDVMIKWLLDEDPHHPFLVVLDGETRLHPMVEVHHIDRDRSNNDRSNLIAVTKQAHSDIHHKGLQPGPSDCWPPNPQRY